MTFKYVVNLPLTDHVKGNNLFRTVMYIYNDHELWIHLPE